MKTYKFYRNFAILCGVLFVLATVVFFVCMVKYLYLNPYSKDTDTLKQLIVAAMLFQTYLAYMIFGCYKQWKRLIRYNSYTRAANKSRKLNAEYTAFINKHLNY